LSNAILVIASLVVVALPLLTAAGIVSQRWGVVSAVFGAVLAYLGLTGVSSSFITARNNLQIAKYRYYSNKNPTDKDRETLIATYEKDKTLASYLPSAPPRPEKSDAPAAEKSNAPAAEK
jgi:hypothetical protein